MTEPTLRVGIDLGGSKIELAAFGAEGQECFRKRVPTPQRDYPATLAALRDLVALHDDIVVVYPVHLNPSVQRAVNDTLGNHPRIVLTPPLDYLPFVDLSRRAYLILTDSGGVQEEAPSLRVPVLVLRDTTERPEGIEAGVAQLVGTERDGIVSAAQRLLEDRAAHQRMVTARNPYGDGTAAAAIVRHLEHALV